MTVTTPITTLFKWEATAAEVVAGIDLAGSRVIVTGGASGIGARDRAWARHHRRRGDARGPRRRGRNSASPRRSRPPPETPISWSRVLTSPTRRRSRRSSPRGTDR